MLSRTGLQLLFKYREGQPEPVHPDRVHMDAALSWLMRAQDLTGTGGVAGFYSLFTGWHDAYPETTGYIIQTLTDHYQTSGDEFFLRRAVAMADWEIDIQLPGGGVRGFCLPQGVSSTPLVFDAGQVILGWTSLYRQTKESKYLDASLRAALWLLENQEVNGIWRSHVYRRHCGTYHTRVAWAMLRVANETMRDDLRQGALAFLRWAMSHQTPSGFFHDTGFQPGSDYFTHAIAYTLEGLIGASWEVKDAALAKKLMASVLYASEPLLAEYTRTGTLYGEYNSDFKPMTKRYRCVTGTAQIAWCFLKVFDHTRDARYFRAALALIDDVKSTQLLNTGNSTLDGSIPGSCPVWGRYQRWRLVTWAAKFLCDALMAKKEAISTISYNKLNKTPPQEKPNESQHPEL